MPFSFRTRASPRRSPHLSNARQRIVAPRPFDGSRTSCRMHFVKNQLRKRPKAQRPRGSYRPRVRGLLFAFNTCHLSHFFEAETTPHSPRNVREHPRGGERPTRFEST